MQHEDGNGRRKGAVHKRQCRSITLDGTNIDAANAGGEPRHGLVVVFEAGYTRRNLRQLERRRTGSGAQFQDMRSQFCALEHPWQQLPARHIAPECRPAKPVLKRVHKSFLPIGNRRIRILDDSIITMLPSSSSRLIAGRFFKRSDSLKSVLRATLLKRITDGRAGPPSASRSPKSISVETITRFSSRARERISESGAL